MITKIIGTAILIITMVVVSEILRKMQRYLLDSTPSNRWFEIVLDELVIFLFLGCQIIIYGFVLYELYQKWNSAEIMMVIAITMYVLKRFVIRKVLDKIENYIHKYQEKFNIHW